MSGRSIAAAQLSGRDLGRIVRIRLPEFEVAGPLTGLIHAAMGGYIAPPEHHVVLLRIAGVAPAYRLHAQDLPQWTPDCFRLAADELIEVEDRPEAPE